jgi:hypothetical protein
LWATRIRSHTYAQATDSHSYVLGANGYRPSANRHAPATHSDVCTADGYGHPATTFPELYAHPANADS